MQHVRDTVRQLERRPGHSDVMVPKQVGVLVLIGAAAGIAAALGLARVVEALLFGVSGYDPRPFAAALVVLGVVVLAASYFPARRASAVEPMTSLRYE